MFGYASGKVGQGSVMCVDRVSHSPVWLPPALDWVARPRPRPTLPLAKVVHLLGCQLATMGLKIKIVIIPKGGWHGRSCHPIWDVSASWAELHETGGLSSHLGSKSGKTLSCNPALKRFTRTGGQQGPVRKTQKRGERWDMSTPLPVVLLWPSWSAGPQKQ